MPVSFDQQRQYMRERQQHCLRITITIISTITILWYNTQSYMDCRPISSCPVSNVPKQSRYTRMHCKHTHTNAHANHAYAWATCYAYADLNVRHIQWTFTQERKLYRKRRHVRGYNTSHAHTVVWECCKDDRQSQWGMAKFDHQPTLNPWTDRHQIWNTWLRRGYLPPQKIRDQSAQGFLPLTYVKYTPKTFECLLLIFLSSSEGLETRSLDRFSRLIRHITWFCAR